MRNSSSKILQSIDNNTIEWNLHKKQTTKKSFEKTAIESTVDVSFNSDPINDSSTDFDSIDEKIMGLSMENSAITCNSIIFTEDNKISFNDQLFKIDNIFDECSSFKIYNVHNDKDQGFILKQIFYSSNFQLCDCITLYNRLKDNIHICKIYDFDISYEKRCVTIIFEKVQKIDIKKMDQNAIKQSIKQILKAVEAISSSNLKFDSCTFQDFVSTDNGIKLLNFERLSILHTQIFRIPTMGYENQSSSSFCLFNLIEQFCHKNDDINTIFQQAQIEDIPQILTNHYFDEAEDLLVDISNSQLKEDNSDDSQLFNESDSQSLAEDSDPQYLDDEIILQQEELPPSPVNDIINLISREIEPCRKQTHSSEESAVQNQIPEMKNHFNFSQIDFSFSIGTLLMLTISLILKGIHESNFGFGNACEVFFGLRLFWILLICELFYIVFRMKSQKHKKYISKKIYQYIIILAVLLFLINASLVFHLFLSRISSFVPSFTLFITLCWILLSLPLLND